MEGVECDLGTQQTVHYQLSVAPSSSHLKAKSPHLVDYCSKYFNTTLLELGGVCPFWGISSNMAHEAKEQRSKDTGGTVSVFSSPEDPTS